MPRFRSPEKDPKQGPKVACSAISWAHHSKEWFGYPRTFSSNNKRAPTTILRREIQSGMYNPKRRRVLSPKLQQNWEGPPLYSCQERCVVQSTEVPTPPKVNHTSIQAN
ncbi:hypothetical protein AVEN_121281-1 [Araneus ventricosus]|uniref:Uncharacterized protein n=1 Tax=Araneus ventricosus TaxID=182803 RepID=A0A4Y2SKZ2_ARAVE|nr:hypothetical protein AVEN_121281-1 [Araneus ventricosus]